MFLSQPDLIQVGIIWSSRAAIRCKPVPTQESICVAKICFHMLCCVINYPLQIPPSVLRPDSLEDEDKIIHGTHDGWQQIDPTVSKSPM